MKIQVTEKFQTSTGYYKIGIHDVSETVAKEAVARKVAKLVNSKEIVEPVVNVPEVNTAPKVTGNPVFNAMPSSKAKAKGKHFSHRRNFFCGFKNRFSCFLYCFRGKL